MNDTMTESTDDLSALAWVHEELRRSMEAAHKGLRRFLKESDALGESDLDAVDPAILRAARSQFHQGAGALELINLPAAAKVLRASEAAVNRVIAKPDTLNLQTVEEIERASFALLDYLSRLLGGARLTPLAMFPQYRALQLAAGADRIHPADLWAPDWQWRALPSDPQAQPRQPDATTHATLENLLLMMMRGQQAHAAMARMSDVCAGLGAGASDSHVATLWKLASAVFEAQSLGLLGPDVYSKRLAPRLLAQFRSLERGETDVSQRLVLDLLFFCAQSASPGDGRRAPRLAAVRQVYALAHHVPVDYSVSALGRFDPAWIAQARKRVVAAKESWSAVAGAEMHRLAGLAEQFSLVGDSLRRLFPMGETFADELQQAVLQTQQHGHAPPAALAMEVATSLLYVEAVLESADFDHAELPQRVRHLAERLSRVRQGQPPEPLEAWMEELYRRVSDRQTMGSVVQELRATLSEAETLIDQYFRDPSQRSVLIPVPNHLSAMRGVLSVLGMDHATQALLRMRDEVEGLIQTEVEPEHVVQAGVFERLAGNMGALGFLIDMLSVQPQTAKSLFAYDPESGRLASVMGRGSRPLVAGAGAAASPLPPASPRLIEQAQMLAFSSVREDVPVAEVTRDLERLSAQAVADDQPMLAAAVASARRALGAAGNAEQLSAARGLLSEALVDFVSTSSEPVGLDAPKAGAGEALLATLALPTEPQDEEEIDAEMREVFLEEAREVLHDADAAVAILRDAPSELPLLAALRRAFHTLKGSSRMVGLMEFGEAAWSCEQVYNTQLAEQQPAGAPLLAYTRRAIDDLAAWVEDIAAQRPSVHTAGAMALAAQHLAERLAALETLPDTDLPLEESAAAEAGSTAAFPAPAPVSVFEALETHATDGVGESELSFEFDLSGPDLEHDIANRSTTAQAVHASAAPTLPVEFDSSAEPDFDLNFDLTLDTAPAPADGDEADPNADLPVTLLLEQPAFDQRPDALPMRAEVSSLFASEPSPEQPPALPDFDFDLAFGAAVPVDAELTPAAAAPEPEPEPEPPPPFETAERAQPHEDELYKSVGPLRISIALFNIYLNEADELSRHLCTELAEWAMELHQPVGDTPIALAHSLAGCSATVGFSGLSHLARTLEHAQTRSQSIGRGTPDEAFLFVDAAEEIRRLLHQFAAGFLKEPSPELLARLTDHELSSAQRLETMTAASDLHSASVDETADADSLGSPLDSALEGRTDVSLDSPLEGRTGVSLDSPLDTSPNTPLDTPLDTPKGSPLDRALDRPITLEPDPPEQVTESAPQLLVPLHTDAARADETALPAERSVAAAARFDALGLPELKPFGALAVEGAHAVAAEPPDALDGDAEGDFDAVDAVDAELFPIFEEEGEELLLELDSHLRAWLEQPTEAGAPAACMRALHTLKGGARLAGAMRLGELAHRLESRIEWLAAHPPAEASDIETLQSGCDAMSRCFEALRASDAQSYAQAAVTLQTSAVPAVPGQTTLGVLAGTPAPSMSSDHRPADLASAESQRETLLDGAATLPPTPATGDGQAPSALAADAFDAASAIDWSRFVGGDSAPRSAPERVQAAAQTTVRVRAPLLDQLVNHAGEVSIARSRIEAQVQQIKASLVDLTENLDRLRSHLHDIELQAETQMSSRIEAAKAAAEAFDPLESDRFTRFQEITRSMAESVNDVATVQRTLQRSLQSAEDELIAQARLTRDLQDGLLRTRMVEFESQADRLYRVVRLAAKETGKQVRLDIVGGAVEVDRGVLERMTPAFEHLLRNCVTHGIESPQARSDAGKEANGSITVALSHEGNEVGVEVRDDGAGLNLPRIREKGLALGLLAPDAQPTDGELANLIFKPGFSTAGSVTELAGRGIGMDVVLSEVNAMGGRIETATAAGQGTSFKLILPLTTAVTQVVMLRCGSAVVAVPSTLVEIVRRALPEEIDAAHASGSFTVSDRSMPFYWLGALLQQGPRSTESSGRTRAVVVVRSAQQRVAVQVDEVLGNHEVVVKNLGAQMVRLPGLAGITLLASGAVALIYNPVALATLYGDDARAAGRSGPDAGLHGLSPTPAAVAPLAPLVLVVDDSLTVRRVTQRLLVREGYRVTLAKDGLDALERLAEELPRIVLSDIEMPRMDGFDLVRNMRADERLRGLPVIMITSRIAQKHRDYAAELGVAHYLGKPYSEEDLLALVGRYTTADSPG